MEQNYNPRGPPRQSPNKLHNRAMVFISVILGIIVISWAYYFLSNDRNPRHNRLQTPPSQPGESPITETSKTILPPSDASAPVEQTTLRSLASAKNFGIGSAAQYIPLISANEQNYSATLKREYNMLTPENEMKWDTIHPTRDTYNFAPADTLVRFAKENNMSVRGHTLVWRYQLPVWLTHGNFTSTQLETILKDHITTVVQYYKTNFPGRVVAWDVVNEAFSDSGALHPTIWSKIGASPTDYIRKAFQWARDADPSAKLFYNDYDMEFNSGKAQAVANLLKNLKRDGIPIDGVGFQGHVDSTQNLSNLKNNMELFTGAGFEIQFTEVDVPLTTLDQQATTYRTLVNACVQNSLCTAFVTWGFTDKYSWKSGQSPLPFDAGYAPKPAYAAIKEIIRRSSLPITETPETILPPVDQTQVDVNVITDNDKPRQIIEGFGATHQTLVYGGGLGDVLTPSLRRKALDALFNQIKITTGQIPTIFEAPANSTLSNFYHNQANDDNDPFNLNCNGFAVILGDTFKQKVIDIAGSRFNLYPDVRISITAKSSWLSHIQSSDYNRFLDECAEQALAGITYWKNTYGSEPAYAMLFNEPNSGNRELGGHNSAQTVVDIIRRSGERLRQAGFNKVKFVVPSDATEFISLDTAKAILADSGARQYVGAIGYHPYPYLSTYSWPPNILETSGKGQPDQSRVKVRNQLRDLVKPYGIKLFMTEVTSGPASQSKPINPLSYDVFRARAIHIYDEFTYADASAFFGMNSMWDAISQKEHFKGRGYEDDIFADEGDIIRIDNSTEKVYITGMGRAMGHYARWINNGAVRVETTSSDSLLQVTSFRDDAKKQIVWVAINNAPSKKIVKFETRGLSLGGDLEGEQSTKETYWQKLPNFKSNNANSFTINLPSESVTTIIGQIK